MKNNEPGMTLIVKTITRLTLGLILIYGIYIVLRGHIGPGGGFAGGVIITLSFIHLMLAYGKDALLKKLNQVKAVFLASLGATAFLFMAVWGFTGKYHLAAGHTNCKILAAGLMPLCDIAIAIMVSAGLLVIFLALVQLIAEKEKK